MAHDDRSDSPSPGNGHPQGPRPRPRVVIIGAGFGGLSAALALKDADADVVLIDKTNHHLFQPLLYQVATAALSPAQIAQPIRAITRRQPNCTVILGRVTGIDLAGRRVLGVGPGGNAERDLAYDHLVIATGATHDYFGHEAWRPVALGLKSIEDATTLRQRILSAFEQAEASDSAEEQQALLTFVVIGGGPTGVEMAGAIVEIAQQILKTDFRRIAHAQARVVLVEGSDRLLRAFPEALSQRALKDLQRLGVEVALGQAVSDCTREGVLIGARLIPSRCIVWAAGVKASPAGQWLGAPTDRVGRVQVQPDLGVPGCPGVYVVGDTATLSDARGVPVPGLAPAAQQQGQYVARCILAALRGRPAPPPFVYRNLGTMATIGRGAAVVDLSGWLAGWQLRGHLAWWFWGIVHLMPLVGFRNRFIVACDWLWSYLTRQRGVRLITESNSSTP